MFLKIYKSGHLAHYLSIIVIAFALWVPTVFNDSQNIETGADAPLFNLLIFILGSNHLLISIINFPLIIVGALLINAIINENDITNKTSLLGVFFFVILSFANPSFSISIRFSIVNILLLLMLNQLYKIPKTDFSLSPLYNASVLLGAAALFYLPLLFLLPFILLVLLRFRVTKWREYVVTFIGVGMPLFFAFVYYFFFDLTDVFIKYFYDAFTIDIALPILDITDIVIFTLSSGIIISSFLMQINSLYAKNIALRQKLAVILWLFVFTIIVVVFNIKNINGSLLLLIPSTIILSSVSDDMKKLKWVDLYISLIALLIFINQYYQFFDA